MNNMERKGLKAPAYASLTLAFASFGDAFLYPFLPLNSMNVGVPVEWVGVLLSVNRLVRIFSNVWMVKLFAHYGLRLITILAAILAIVSTAGYAMATSIAVWLLFRIAWGLAFSAMRIGTLGYSLQQSQQGFSLGLTRGIQELGPMTALLLAPELLTYFSNTTIFLLLTTLSLPALYFAWNLPKGEDSTSPLSEKAFLQFPTPLNAITFTSALLIDGVMVVVLGILFLQYKESISLLTATALAALYLGYRRICLVIISPVGGWASDKLGINRIFNVSLAAVIFGFIVLTLGWIETGAIVVFTFYSVVAAITPGYVSQQQTHPLSAVAANATWRDIGAVLGTLIGGLLLTTHYLHELLIFSIFSLMLLLFIHLGTAQRILKLWYTWK
jgi:MFS family permease